MRTFLRPSFLFWAVLLWWFWPSVIFLVSGGQSAG